MLGKGRNVIPSSKLQKFQDEDFFQKNTSLEKGWTFNDEGQIVEYKKPKISKELQEKVGYEVEKKVVVEASNDRIFGKQLGR